MSKSKNILAKVILIIVTLVGLANNLYAKDRISGTWALDVGWFNFDRSGRCWVSRPSGIKRVINIEREDLGYFANINKRSEVIFSNNDVYIQEKIRGNVILEWVGKLTVERIDGMLKLEISGKEYCNGSQASMDFKITKLMNVDYEFDYHDEVLEKTDKKLFDFTRDIRLKHKVPKYFDNYNAALHIYNSLEKGDKLTRSEIAWLSIVANPTGENFSSRQKASILLYLPTDTGTNVLSTAYLGIDARVNVADEIFPEEISQIIDFRKYGMKEGLNRIGFHKFFDLFVDDSTVKYKALSRSLQ